MEIVYLILGMVSMLLLEFAYVILIIPLLKKQEVPIANKLEEKKETKPESVSLEVRNRIKIAMAYIHSDTRQSEYLTPLEVVAIEIAKDKGLVTRETVLIEEGEKNYYKLTPAGRTFLLYDQLPKGTIL